MELIAKARALLVINTVAYVVMSVIGALPINDAIDAGYDIPFDGSGDGAEERWYAGVGAEARWNVSIGYANPFVLLAGAVGAAVALPRSGSQGSFAAAANSGRLALVLNLLALGLTVKQITLGANGDNGNNLVFAVMSALLLGCVSVNQLLCTIIFKWHMIGQAG